MLVGMDDRFGTLSGSELSAVTRFAHQIQSAYVEFSFGT